MRSLTRGRSAAEGAAPQSLFVTEELARNGYVVIAPDHKDAGCIRMILDELPKTPEFASRVDVNRSVVVGHSLGGYTMMAMAGAWPSWKDSRIKAVLLFSPYAAPFLFHFECSQYFIEFRNQGHLGWTVRSCQGAKSVASCVAASANVRAINENWLPANLRARWKRF